MNFCHGVFFFRPLCDGGGPAAPHPSLPACLPADCSGVMHHVRTCRQPAAKLAKSGQLAEHAELLHVNHGEPGMCESVGEGEPGGRVGGGGRGENLVDVWEGGTRLVGGRVGGGARLRV